MSRVPCTISAFTCVFPPIMPRSTRRSMGNRYTPLDRLWEENCELRDRVHGLASHLSVFQSESAVSLAFVLVLAFALAFPSVIPEANLLLPLSFLLSFPKGICCCRCLSCCHSRRESAVALHLLLSQTNCGILLLVSQMKNTWNRSA